MGGRRAEGSAFEGGVPADQAFHIVVTASRLLKLSLSARLEDGVVTVVE
jgi:hypothetical protein